MQIGTQLAFSTLPLVTETAAILSKKLETKKLENQVRNLKQKIAVNKVSTVKFLCKF